MKRRIFFVFATLLLLFLLSGCRFLCRHDWESATCHAPQTCSKCGKTQGEKLVHKWEKATCEDPKTCRLCGETKGAALGHQWKEATCESPQYCFLCGAQQGAALGHAWQEATCLAPKTCVHCSLTEGQPLAHFWLEATTEAPKTCENCGLTEGMPLQTDSRFSTDETKDLQGTWKTDFAVSGSMMNEPNFTDTLTGTAYLTLGNTGLLMLRLELDNMPEFEEAMLRYAKKRIYDEFTAKGISESAADLVILATFGMTTDEYAAQIVAEIDVPGILSELTKNRVYYAQSNTMYIADNWNSDFLSSAYRFENGGLIFTEVYLKDPASPLRWTKTQ